MSADIYLKTYRKNHPDKALQWRINTSRNFLERMGYTVQPAEPCNKNDSRGRAEKEKGETHMNGENMKNQRSEKALEIFDMLDDEKKALFLAYLRAVAEEKPSRE